MINLPVMNPNPFDYVCFIGRFQLFHNGHKAMLDWALTQAKNVIVIVGSANQPRTIRNPFTANERILMVSSVYRNLLNVYPKAITFREVNDYLYNDNAWTMCIQDIVDSVIEDDGKDPDAVRVGLIGNKKDHTSYYLDLFPQWEYLTACEGNVMPMMNASDLRDTMFGEDIHRSTKILQPLLPTTIMSYVEEFKKTSDFGNLAIEWGYIKEYKKSWEKAPYEPTFVTVDSVVVQSGHILLVKRRANPGKGLWALPGGFLNPHERIVDGMLRELREETKLKVPEPVLKGSIKGREVFDHPDRSLRGRTITHAFYIELNMGPLPRVKGSDDAEKAKWVPLNEIKGNMMFEDHASIIAHFCGIKI